MSLLGWAHEKYVYQTRIQRLSELISRFIPEGATLLDLGCGDGKLAWSLQQRRPDLRIEGMDVLVRRRTWLPVAPFDGARIPFVDASVDGVMLIDVLHHTKEPLKLLQEALRVSRRWLIIKDHVLHGFAARFRLRLMDWVGNSRYAVPLPYNYLSQEDWSEMRRILGVKVAAEMSHLALYSGPANYIFGAGLHFIAVWQRAGAGPDEKDTCQDPAAKPYGP
jgi:SAM-dependent methyltransferase